MELPSNNVRDYPNMTKVVNEFVAEINEKSPYHYGNHQKSNLWNVHYYYIEGNAFVIDYDWFGNAAAMSIEFGSRGTIDGDGGRKEGLDSRYPPPFGSILWWVRLKGIKFRRHSKVNGRFIKSYSLLQTTWMIQRKIARHGTRAKGWGQQIVAEVFPTYEERFNEALVQDMEYQMLKYYPDLVK